jgi:hypothetical protein
MDARNLWAGQSAKDIAQMGDLADITPFQGNISSSRARLIAWVRLATSNFS